VIYMRAPPTQLPIFCFLWRKAKGKQHNCCTALKSISETPQRTKVLSRKVNWSLRLPLHARCTIPPIAGFTTSTAACFESRLWLMVAKFLGELAKHFFALLAAEFLFETAQGKSDDVAVMELRA
jgi:hypothetical protein